MPWNPYAAKKRLQALGRLKTGQMNQTEAAYARVLETRLRAGEILWYRFECIRLRLANKTSYTPDFLVLLANGELEVHEVKGSLAIFADDAKVKFKVAADTFPFRFLLAIPRRKRDGGGWDVTPFGDSTE